MSESPSIGLRAAQWLLNLDQIRLGDDAPLYLKWSSPYPAWLLFVFSVVVLGFIALAYGREQGGWVRRAALAAVRAGLAALVIATLCGPVLVWQRNKVWPAHVAVLLDTSASMGRADRYEAGDLAAGIARGAGEPDVAALSGASRFELVRRALAAEGAAPLRTVLARHGLRVHQFSGGSQPVLGASNADELDGVLATLDALRADGEGSHLAQGLSEVLKQKDGARLAAVVLATDGQSTEPSAAAALAEVVARAQSQQVPIYPLLIGSPSPIRDVGIRSMSWDGQVFAKDICAVRVRLESSGMTAPTAVTVRLIDPRRDAVAASQSVTLGPDTPAAEVELRTKPLTGQAGRIRFRVEVEALEGEAELDNNHDVAEVTVRDEACRVLYVENGPRFDYRYLKNALIREETIKTSVLLLSADRSFAQEGTAPIRRFPESEDELNGYDVVLFGDVDPLGDWLSPSQAEMLVEFVGRRGGGFGLIAGEHHAPHRFRGTPLEKLVPVKIDPDFLGAVGGSPASSFTPQLTREGERSRLFRFTADGASSAELVHALPGWYWFARTLGPKPGAETLLENPAATGPAGSMPLVVMGRYGAGRTLFHGSDDTWRWRRHTGELVYDGYWVQVVRALMPASGSSADAAQRIGRLLATRRTYRYGERVEIQLHIDDAAALARLEGTIPLQVRDRDDAPVARLDAKRLGDASSVFEAAFVPPGAGTYALSVDGAALPGLTPGQSPPAASIRVEGGSLESARTEADHALLSRLAEETGGKAVRLDQIAETLGELKDRSLQIPDDVTETLWDSKLVLMLFVLGVTLEWIVRKACGMI